MCTWLATYSLCYSVIQQPRYQDFKHGSIRNVVNSINFLERKRNKVKIKKRYIQYGTSKVSYQWHRTPCPLDIRLQNKKKPKSLLSLFFFFFAAYFHSLGLNCSLLTLCLSLRNLSWISELHWTCWRTKMMLSLCCLLTERERQICWLICYVGQSASKNASALADTRIDTASPSPSTANPGHQNHPVKLYFSCYWGLML